MMKDIYHDEQINVVVDNNILIDLFELGRLDILFKIFDKVVIPFSIIDKEISPKVSVILKDTGYIIGHLYGESGLKMYHVLINENEFRNLSNHDRLAISIANELDYYCISNDKYVRKTCGKWNVKHTGILGVLGRAFVREIITKAQLEEYIAFLVSTDSTCYITNDVIQDFEVEIQHFYRKT